MYKSKLGLWAFCKHCIKIMLGLRTCSGWISKTYISLRMECKERFKRAGQLYAISNCALSDDYLLLVSLPRREPRMVHVTMLYPNWWNLEKCSFDDMRYISYKYLHYTSRSSAMKERRWRSLETKSHYTDVMISAMEPQITNISIVYSTVCSGADQRKTSNFCGDRWIPHTKVQ